MLKFWKKFRYFALGGVVLQFWGCGGGGGGWWGRMLWDGVYYAGYEFLLDNDGVFDLFAD